jgi:hypothetical protein
LRAASRNIKQSGNAVLDTLAEINAVAAKNSHGWVSETCWVTAQTSDGASQRSVSLNIGQQAGMVPHIVGGVDISEWIKKNFRAAPGKEITFVQGAGVKTGPYGATPMPPRTGDPRIFEFSGSSINVPLLSTIGERCAFADLVQMDANVELCLNEEVVVPFARISLTGVHPIAQSFPKPLYPWPQLKPRLLVNGTEVPRGWEYSVGYWIEANTHRAVFPPCSRGLRNLAFLGREDEMVIVAPATTIEFSWKDGQKSPSAIAHARIGWRSRLDGTIG